MPSSRYAYPPGGGTGGAASDYLSVLTASEVSITGATTATISKQHVVTGTSADYTITLPAASGNSGKFLSFRFGPALTDLSKVITLDGNASETIDGSVIRLCWAGESCILYCDGSNWFKIAGKTIPMVCKASRALTDQGSITANTWTAIIMDGKDSTASNCPAAMYDSGNGRIKSLRNGFYKVNAFAYCSTSLTFLYVGIGRNGSPPIEYQQSGAVSAQAAAAYNEEFYVPTNDYLQTFVYGDSASTLNIFGSAAPALSSFMEIPSW